jgi:hypothetical protein
MKSCQKIKNQNGDGNGNKTIQMKSLLQENLLQKFPQFFSTDRKIYTGEDTMNDVQELLDQKEMVLPIQFGFECGDGWYMLLEELMESIEWHLDPEHQYPRKERIPFQINQIKEKFGGLRFYYSGGDDVIRGMVFLAESLSLKICEHCGSTKNVTQTKGWISTLCEDCMKNEK